MKRFGMAMGLVLVFFLSLSSLAQEKIYTIQIASLKTLKDAQNLYLQLEKTLPEGAKDFLRIEKIGRFYVIRIGRFSSPEQAKAPLNNIRRQVPDAFLRTAFYIEDRILVIYKKSLKHPVKHEVTEKTSPPSTEEELQKQVSRPGPSETLQKPAPREPSPQQKVQPQKIKGVNSFYLSYLIGLLIIFGLVVLFYTKRFRYLYFFKKISGLSHEFLMGFSSDPRGRVVKLKEKLQELTSLVKTNKTSLPFKTYPPDGYNVKNLWILEKPDRKILKSNNMVYINTDVNLPSGEVLPSIIISGDKITIGEGSTIRAIIAKGPIKVFPNTKVLELVDSDSEIVLSEGTEILEAATSSGRITLSKGVFFRCLYGLPITTYNYKPNKHFSMPENLKDFAPPKGQNILRINKTIQSPGGSIDIPPKNKVNQHIMAGESITIGEQSVVKGNIKAGRKIVISRNAVIEGSISVNDEVVIGEDTIILGDSISAKNKVLIHSGARIGKKEMSCIIRCDGNVVLYPDVEIYGTIITKNGLVL